MAVMPKCFQKVLRRSLFLASGALLLSVGLGAPAAEAKGNLKYPADCKEKKLRDAAKKGGCTIQSGGNHDTVKKGNEVVTQIPHSVKDNGTCRGIIKDLNTHCG